MKMKNMILDMILFGFLWCSRLCLTPDELKEVLDESAKEVKDALGEVKKSHENLDGKVGEIEKQLKEQGKEYSETKSDFQECVERVQKAEDIVDELIEKMSKLPDQTERKDTLGGLVAESEAAKNYKGGNAVIADFEGPLFEKAALTSGSGSGEDLVQPFRREGILVEPEQTLTVRDLLTVLPVSSNSVEWAKENVFTNAAAPQNGENTAKAESGITFTKQSTPVETLAHWIPISRQILADAPSLRAFVETRMRYGLKLKEEGQLLTGDGTNGNLTGLIPNATSYASGTYNLSGDTKIDQLRHAILQVTLSNYPTTGILLNPEDMHDIELIKTDDKAYVFANPANQTEPRVWGKRVVESNSMTASEFLLGAFSLAATLWDREQITVRVAEEHADFFIKNMVALLLEERLALTIERPLAFVTGTLVDLVP